VGAGYGRGSRFVLAPLSGPLPDVPGRPVKPRATISRQSRAALWQPSFHRRSRCARYGTSIPTRRDLLQRGAPPARSQRRIVLRSAPTMAAMRLRENACRVHLCSFLVARLPPHKGILTASLRRCWSAGIGSGRGHAARAHDRLFRNLLGNPSNAEMLAVDNGPNGITFRTSSPRGMKDNKREDTRQRTLDVNPLSLLDSRSKSTLNSTEFAGEPPFACRLIH